MIRCPWKGGLPLKEACPQFTQCSLVWITGYWYWSDLKMTRSFVPFSRLSTLLRVRASKNSCPLLQPTICYRQPVINSITEEIIDSSGNVWSDVATVRDSILQGRFHGFSVTHCKATVWFSMISLHESFWLHLVYCTTEFMNILLAEEKIRLACINMFYFVMF